MPKLRLSLPLLTQFSHQNPNKRKLKFEERKSHCALVYWIHIPDYFFYQYCLNTKKNAAVDSPTGAADGAATAES